MNHRQAPTSLARTSVVDTVDDVGTVLGVWAHPDDEAFLSAALMARARDAGQRVVVATASPGERGTPDPLRWPPQRLARLRRQELARSLDLVGVSEHQWLGYRDGELAQVPGPAAVAQVADLIDQVRPDTIITFGPDGMTGHQDHRTVSGWATAACHLTGRPCRLWYATLTPSFHRAWGPLNDGVGLWLPGSRPPATAEGDLALQVVCDESLSRRKYDALRAHASKIDGLVAAVGEETFRSWWAVESFVDAERVVAHAGR